MTEISISRREDLAPADLSGASHLRISCALTEFPEKILEAAETLRILDLAGNQLSELPEAFAELKNLKVLFLSQNAFTRIPPVLGQCRNLDFLGMKSNQVGELRPELLPPSLRWLTLTDNQINKISPGIRGLPRLQKFLLAGNRLKELPSDLAECKNLELLRLSGNLLPQIPEWLLKLPRLAWLACANGASSMAPEPCGTCIPWQNLKLGAILGQGASGTTYQAQIRSSGEDVAVKVFKGSVTSDGYANDEIRAALLASQHSAILRAFGAITNHPEGLPGLILELIPSTFQNLGSPPSFESCTRDVYRRSPYLTAAQLHQIAAQMASALRHLHAQGLMHGDFYAHNILIDQSAKALLGDFGAATYYGSSKNLFAKHLERIEVRAFGYLLDDLLSNLMIRGGGASHLEKLRDSFLDAVPERRPCFREIEAELLAA